MPLHSRILLTSILAITLVVAGLTVATTASVTVAADQIEAGALANWADLSTWSRPAPARGQTETGLGLVAAGSSGDMRLAFYVVRPVRGRATTPRDIGVRAASSALMNPNLIRTPTLSFTGVGASKKTVLVDVSDRMAVDNPAPGAAVTSGVATMTIEEFREIAASTDLRAKVFGADVVLREDQIEAIRAFRDRVLPPAR